MEASHDLGASPIQTFRRVIFPLSIPGVFAGATFAFVLSLGDFLAPLLLGGPSGIMISNIVVSLFGAAYNWPLGAAISLSMLRWSSGFFSFPRIWKRNGASGEPRQRSFAAGFLGTPSPSLRFSICRSYAHCLFLQWSGVGGFPPRNFTLDWYRHLFADDAIWTSVFNSLLVAAAAMAISLAFGIPQPSRSTGPTSPARRCSAGSFCCR